MKPKFLGKKNATFKSPSESILDAINRESSKEMFGEDIWNAYDFNFLSKNNQPFCSRPWHAPVFKWGERPQR